MNWLALALSALVAWGWSGMMIIITAGAPSDVYAQSHPDDAHYLTCRIDINTAVAVSEAQAADVMLHEIGHCVGYYGFSWGDHSPNPDSIMSAFPDANARILPEDFLAVKMNRDMRLQRARIVLPGIAR